MPPAAVHAMGIVPTDLNYMDRLPRSDKPVSAWCLEASEANGSTCGVRLFFRGLLLVSYDLQLSHFVS